MAGSVLIFLQLAFMINVAGLDPGLAGIVLLIGKIWDAVNDPLLGWFSDRTKSKWGRRLPWIVFGAMPLGISFFLMWWVPPFLAGNHWGLFAYYVVIGLIFNTFYTVVTLPYSALTPELTHNYDERSRLTGFRMACSIAGSLGGIIIGFVSTKLSDDPVIQFLIIGGTVGTVIIGSLAVCLMGIWRVTMTMEQKKITQPPDPAERPMSLIEQFRIVLSNKPFMIVCGIYLFSWLGMQFTAGILPLYVPNCLKLGTGDFYLIALTVQFTALLMTPFWSWVSVRLEKKWAYVLAMPTWLIAQAVLYFLQPGQIYMIYLLAFMAGIGISVVYLVPNAMLPDTIELDELKTGKRREGVFYGFFVFLQKMALALATSVVGGVLQAAGYIPSTPAQPSPVQPESALTAIRIAIGPLPAIVLLIGIVLVIMFPITKASHAQTLELLRRRKEGLA